jgi:adenine deaminase
MWGNVHGPTGPGGTCWPKIIALPVVPELKITNLGLVDVTGQQFVPLFTAA